MPADHDVQRLIAQELVSEWPTEAEAAATLQISTKTLARYAEQGKIEIRKRPREGRKAENVVNPDDVERLKPKPFVLADPNTQQPAALVPTGAAGDILTLMRTIANAVGNVQKPDEQPAPKPWVSIAEATELSGLPETVILKLAKAGAIASVRSKTRLVHRQSVLEYRP